MVGKYSECFDRDYEYDNDSDSDNEKTDGNADLLICIEINHTGGVVIQQKGHRPDKKRPAGAVLTAQGGGAAVILG